MAQRRSLSWLVLAAMALWPQALPAQDLATDQPPLLTIAPQESGVSASLRGVCAVNERVCWASGADGTCLRTTDGGKTWQALEVPDAGEVDFRDVHAWSADRALLMGIASPARFFLTEDGGQSWQEVYHNDDPAVFFDGIAFWDEKTGVAFGDPMDGRLALLTTADGGATWQDVEREEIPAAVEGEGGFAASGTSVALGKDGLALVGLGGAVPGKKARIMRSEDYGKSWTVAESPLRADAASGIFSICILDEKHVVAVGGNYTQPEDSAHTAMISKDAGASWRILEDNTPGGYRSAVALVPGSAGKLLVACGPGSVDISPDGGETWAPLSNTGYHALSFGADGIGWLTGSDGRIAKIMKTETPRKLP